MPETVSLMPLVDEVVRLRAENEALRARLSEQAVQFDALLEVALLEFKRSLHAVDLEISTVELLRELDRPAARRLLFVRAFAERVLERNLFIQMMPTSSTAEWRARAYFVGFK